MAAQVQVYSALFPLLFGQEQIGPLTINVTNPATFTETFQLLAGNNYTITPSRYVNSTPLTGDITVLIIVTSASSSPAQYIIKNGATPGDTGLQLLAGNPVVLPVFQGPAGTFNSFYFVNTGGVATITFTVVAL